VRDIRGSFDAWLNVKGELRTKASLGVAKILLVRERENPEKLSIGHLEKTDAM
jgi:hypothetical protein